MPFYSPLNKRWKAHELHRKEELLMSIMVIYESFYGNTEQIAQAIAETLGAELCRVDAVDWDRLQAANIVIFGCPTRAFHASEGMGKFLRGL
jgi:flavodoxin